MAHIPRFVPVLLPWQRRLAEHVPGHGWYQGGERLRRVKPHYTFIWPKDGKRGSKMGRWKDIFANEGPDIHVAISADKRDTLYNRQRRAQWSRWTELDDREPDGALENRPPWVRYFHGQEVWLPNSKVWKAWMGYMDRCAVARGAERTLLLSIERYDG